MTWEGAAKEVAVGGEFNGWAPVPLACQQVTSNTKTHNYTNIQIQSALKTQRPTYIEMKIDPDATTTDPDPMTMD